jgi:hypothetical protein
MLQTPRRGAQDRGTEDPGGPCRKGGACTEDLWLVSPLVARRTPSNLSILFGTGKTSFFVANQANIESIPAERFAELEAEYKAIDEENKILGAEVKALSSGLVFHLTTTVRRLTGIRTNKTKKYTDRR